MIEGDSSPKSGALVPELDVLDVDQGEELDLGL